MFFALSTEQVRSKVKDFLSHKDFNYRVILNADTTSEIFNIYAVPTHIIIDRNGIVRFIQVGADTDTIYDLLESEIRKYL